MISTGTREVCREPSTDGWPPVRPRRRCRPLPRLADRGRQGPAARRRPSRRAHHLPGDLGSWPSIVASGACRTASAPASTSAASLQWMASAPEAVYCEYPSTAFAAPDSTCIGPSFARSTAGCVPSGPSRPRHRNGRRDPRALPRPLRVARRAGAASSPWRSAICLPRRSTAPLSLACPFEPSICRSPPHLVTDRTDLPRMHKSEREVSA